MLKRAEARQGENIENREGLLRLTGMQYLYPQEGLGYFPLLQGYVRQLITWGPNSQNMSIKKGPDKEHAIERTKQAMERVGMVGLERTIRIASDSSATEQILRVTNNTFNTRMVRDGLDTEVGANFIYTTDPTIALTVKPADCTVAILYALLPNGQPLVGLLHGGREQLDIELAFRAVNHLSKLGCIPANILVGVTPSIGYDNYFIPANRKDILKNYEVWKQYKRLREDVDKGRVYLDTAGFLIDQLMEAGIRGNNIQLYDIDTLLAAIKGEGFSQRNSSYNNNDDNKNGRFLTAAQL